MPTIEIRNVPDDLRRDLKVRAAQNGMTLSAYLISELLTLAARPTRQEWLAKAEELAPVEAGETPVEAIAAERPRKLV